MQQINQILFILFALILLGVLTSTINTSKDENHPYIGYWRASITLRATAFFAWAMAPTVGGFLITVANFSFIASGIYLGLVIQSLNKPPSKQLRIYLYFFLMLFAICFEFIRHQNDSYAARLAFTGFLDLIITFWQLLELVFLSRKDKSIGLKIVGTVILFKLALTMTFIVGAVIHVSPGVNQLAQENAMFNLWAGVSAHLISFIIMSSYLYQRTVFNESKTLKNLSEKSSQLVATTKEKNEIEQLLIEKQALIGSLIAAKRTAEAGALSASMAHELNQPLGAIQLNIQFLKSKFESEQFDPELIKKLINNIDQDNQRAARVVSTLRNLFNQGELETKPMLINELVQSIMPILLPHARDRGIQINLDLSSESLVEISSNEFQQVLLNLINNSSEELSGLDLSEKKITIETKDCEGFVEVLISDNGRGVPESMQASIFDLMKTGKQAGMGLGLWLSNHIVERHKGKLTYLQNPGGGAQFQILIPTNLKII